MFMFPTIMSLLNLFALVAHLVGEKLPLTRVFCGSKVAPAQLLRATGTANQLSPVTPRVSSSLLAPVAKYAASS